MSASGIAVSLNPNAPQEQQLQLFYNTKKHNLGVQLRNERSADDERATYAAGDDAQAGIILNPGQVASSSVTGLDIVVGFTKKAAPPTTGDGCHCDPPNQNDVSIISPVYQPLAATQPNNLTIAATSSGSTAWIFFLTGEDKFSTTINEVFLGDDAPGNYSETTRILPGSSLAAYYAGAEDKRYVIYQSDGTKRLWEYSPNPVHVSNEELDNSGDAKPNTSLAVSYSDADRKAYLYYVDNSDQLRVIVKSNGNWGASSAVAHAASPVEPGTQLTVVAAPNGNHIFYVGKGQAAKFQFHHVIDPRR